MENKISPNIIRQIIILFFIFVLGYVLITQLYFALSGFLGAVSLYVVLRVPYVKLLHKFKWKKWQAILLLMLGAFICIALPVYWLGTLLFKNINPIIQNPQLIHGIFDKINAYLITEFNVDLLNKQYIQKLSNFLLPIVNQFVTSTINSIGTIFLSFLFLFFMLNQMSDIEKWMNKNTPFNNENKNKLVNQIRDIVYSNAIGIPIVAFFQGLIGMIGYWIFGAPQILLMGALTAICSIIPVLGSMLVYAPLTLYMLALGHTGAAIGIGLWGLVIIGSVDNISRFLLQKKLSNTHPLVTIFGAIIGVNLFGFWGLVFGPLCISLFGILINLYIDEFGEKE